MTVEFVSYENIPDRQSCWAPSHNVSELKLSLLVIKIMNNNYIYNTNNPWPEAAVNKTFFVTWPKFNAVKPFCYRGKLYFIVIILLV